jgi:hypothetical protein
VRWEMTWPSKSWSIPYRRELGALLSDLGSVADAEDAFRVTHCRVEGPGG